ncbi:unnamed protein product [Urochloa humidicola]
MRLGSRRTFFKTTDCKSARLYGDVNYVDERHRHRYEVNPDMVPVLENGGLQFVGRDETGRRMEIIEIPDHRFYVGVQFHPEFKSRPSRPSALFVGLVAASSGQLEHLLEKSGTGDTTAATKRLLSDGPLAPSQDDNGRAKEQCTGPSNGTCGANVEEDDRA